MPRPPVALLAVVALLATACGPTATSGAGPGPVADPVADDATPTCRPTTDGVVEAEAAGFERLFPWDSLDAVHLPDFDPDEVRQGGPPPDGIAPIDDPCVEPVPEGGAWLADTESVLAVKVGGEARAYPLAILTQHEIVNDVLGGVPVTVTYCPLCNSGIAFERTVDGAVWSFGTSGRLLRSNLVMYDRQTRTLWSQFTGTALWGDADVIGRELQRVPTQVLGWSTFREAHPDGTVLSRSSFPTRSYGRNPYPGYEDDPSSFLYRGPLDERLDPGTRVVGVGDERDAVAVPLSLLQEQRTVTVELDEGPATVVWAPGQVSALDDTEVAGGREVGQTGAFAVAELEPQGDGRFLDPATGAVHDVTGAVVEGDAPPLTALPLDDTFWFVWFAFRPGTAIVAG